MPDNSTLRYKFDKEACLVPVLQQAGWAVFSQAIHDDENLPEHIHEKAYEICYVAHGTVEWFVEGETFEINAGNAFITCPGEKHGGQFGVMNPCELFWAQIIFPIDNHFPGLTESECRWLSDQYSNVQQRVFTASSEIAFYFKQLIDEHRSPKESSKIVARIALIQILIAALRIFKTQELANSQLSQEIKRACDFIDANFQFDLKNEEIAKKANLSVSSFYLRFSEEVGVTPREYITQKRIHKARQLLRNSSISITKIAQSVGFSSSQYFATFFKKITGVSPRQYQRGNSPNPLDE
ncbi:MAG: AraC family transcriptional regulator [Phycisphaerae bacterium]|nr:AraC family transcriptional regulator [Phycisphaerae bacterium]